MDHPDITNLGEAAREYWQHQVHERGDAAEWAPLVIIEAHSSVQVHQFLGYDEPGTYDVVPAVLELASAFITPEVTRAAIVMDSFLCVDRATLALVAAGGTSLAALHRAGHPAVSDCLIAYEVCRGCGQRLYAQPYTRHGHEITWGETPEEVTRRGDEMGGRIPEGLRALFDRAGN